ncbi:tetratricopeptide repeat protein [Runella sp. MFBS21]|uniref:tetratricopeptide repeat protein n=1 Tax=Runella sp. MFBS21 TaxID=3034018 RepID=UPI0023FA1DC9|nr:tetratricopeptide repeat protein [Runella sp. MFBS21]MDF7816794.1 tetratricopeptide repeat protein [Runella sp. MFBS21]
MILRFPFMICLVVLFQSVFANDFDFTPNLQKAYFEVFKLKLPTSQKLIAAEKPSNPFKIYLSNYIDMIEVLNSDSEAAYERFVNKEGKRLEFIEQLNQNSPYNRFLRAEVKMQLAVVKIKFGNEVKAAWNIVQAARLLEENQKLFPNFVPQLKSLGCLHILIGSIPENYNWVIKLLGIKGNIKQGVEELKLAGKDEIWGLEASLISFFLQEYLLKFGERENVNLLKVLENHPDCLSFYIIAVSILLKTGQADQSAFLLKKYSFGEEYPTFPILDLYKADVHLYRGDYLSAGREYAHFLENFKGSTYLKETYFKLFLCYWLTGEESKATQILSKIPVVGKTISEADKAAEKFYENYTKTHQLPNKSLLQIRLATDGGYYEKAARLATNLSEKALITLKEKVEYNFRVGRIFQKNNQPEKAIEHFKRAIRLNEKENWHFGASSSLQIGYIYQLKGQRPLAKDFFNQAISYKKHEYKNTIDGKARAALTEMGYID